MCTFLFSYAQQKQIQGSISVSDSTIGSMLAQEDENGVERDIYYLTQILNDAETRYSLVEKLCLCLYFSCSKLKQYIKPIIVYVYSHFDVVKHMLSKSILHSRVGKWALALSEFSLSYQPLKAIKGQIIVDFIVDHSLVEATEGYVENQPWTLYFDGSNYKNGTTVGIFILSPLTIQPKFKYKIKDFCSNNEAEYKALIVGLEILLGLGAKNVVLKGDSELVVKQLTKEYKCISENLLSYFVSASSLLSNFKSVSFQHVPRIENQVAKKPGTSCFRI
jgi:ribonuclease HI